MDHGLLSTLLLALLNFPCHASTETPHPTQTVHGQNGVLLKQLFL